MVLNSILATRAFLYGQFWVGAGGHNWSRCDAIIPGFKNCFSPKGQSMGRYFIIIFLLFGNTIKLTIFKLNICIEVYILGQIQMLAIPTA